MMTFGERLREIRKAQGISQRGLAKETALHFTYISKMERNRLDVLPSAEAIHRLAVALSADESELCALAGKIPAGLKTMLQESPLLSRLLQILSVHRLPDATYRELIRLVLKEESHATL